MFVPIHQLRPGDFVVPAKATVESIEHFASLVIVDFTDRTAMPPLPANLSVEIVRPAAFAN